MTHGAGGGLLGRLIVSPAAGAVSNMRRDMELFEGFNPGTDLPVLRFYTWDRPCVTYGSGIKPGIFDGVDFIDGVEVAKRPTGGGCVLHDADIAFGFVFPAGMLGGLRVSFEKLSRVFLAAFCSGLGIDGLCVAKDVNKENRHWCFCGPDNYDLTHGGVKLCGMAQRRKRDKHLFQGSISRRPARVEDFVKQPALWNIPVEKSVGLDALCPAFVTTDEVVEAIVAGFFNEISIEFK